MYNWLQLAKNLSKFYRKELKTAEGDTTIISPSIDFGQVLGIWTSGPKNIVIMNTSKLKIGMEETKTDRLCCCGLIIAHFEQPLGEQQMTEILTIF